ncbi:putative peptidase family-domain-containing protein [Triangularia verruculosa]|uniref:Peptidase family-domain-containing protein n=1 Tax=Triangularia verruculosa TaxID=2587418 RepID=A0AAN6XR72_9PEZI|nr:putative peptidase family-domain-containing protein [Triangularia verruculosa]
MPSTMPFTIDNFDTDSVVQVHQRCILITGTTDTTASHISVKSQVGRGQSATPDQRWPVSNGHFKALVLLASGMNTIRVVSSNNDDDKAELRVRYRPLLKSPPLYLAILIAKDSLLSIDCHPLKFGTLSSTHSSLEAAIAKFRVTALMWQAIITDEMQRSGLGRRTFRLQEEWGIDTLTREHVQTSFTEPENAHGWVPRVHLVRTDKTVAELRQIERGRGSPNNLDAIFVEALEKYGGPFVSKARPVVAGLVLDSHYDDKRGRVLGHEAIGRYDPGGISVATFGSHLAYAWPRFMDEIPECLLDARPTSGGSVSNDRCYCLWETCAVGQVDFLQEVRRAFGAESDFYFQARDIVEWVKAFLPRTAYCYQDEADGTEYDSSDLSWQPFRGDLRDALFLRATRPHFKLPGDKTISSSPPRIEINGTLEKASISIYSESKIRKVTMQGPNPLSSYGEDEKSWQAILEKDFIANNRQRPWRIKALGDNGLEVMVPNIWAHLHPATALTLPGHPHIIIEKKSAASRVGAYGPDWHPWTVMFKKRNADGKLVRATKIALHVGDALDGAMVYYKDGTVANCGRPGYMPGGHQKRIISLKNRAGISCVAVTRAHSDRAWWPLIGLRMWTFDGRSMGALNMKHAGKGSPEFLTPGKGRKVIGLFGHHGRGGNLCTEFGIITAPSGVKLPEEVYDPEKWEALDPKQGILGKHERDEVGNGEEERRRRSKRRRLDKEPKLSDKSAVELDEDSDSSTDGEVDDDGGDSVDRGYDDFQHVKEQHVLQMYQEIYEEGKRYMT